jgi:hypothetical protein
MRPAAIEGMINRTYHKMLDAEDFGIRMAWWHRMHRWIGRRPRGRR